MLVDVFFFLILKKRNLKSRIKIRILREVNILQSVCGLMICMLCITSCSNDLSLLVLEKEIAKRQKEQLLSVRYPEFKNRESKLKRGCDSINRDITVFIDSLLLDMECDQESESDFSSRELKVDYDLDIFAQNYVSAKFMIYKYHGGEHGFTYYKCINYNVQKARSLSLGDVFHVKDKMELHALNKLLVKYFKNPDNCFDVMPVVTSSFKSFSYQGDFFVFSFSDSSLGPYVCGTAEIKIPVWELKQHGLLRL